MAILIGGEPYFEQWWTEDQPEGTWWRERLEVFAVADFLRCWELTTNLERYLIEKFEVLNDLAVAAKVHQYLSDSPRDRRLRHACFCSIALQALANMCRRWGAEHLDHLLRQHAVNDMASLQHLIAKHAEWSNNISLISDCALDSVLSNGHQQPDGSKGRQLPWDTMQLHLKEKPSSRCCLPPKMLSEQDAVRLAKEGQR